jgi:hypothetical protein
MSKESLEEAVARHEQEIAAQGAALDPLKTMAIDHAVALGDIRSTLALHDNEIAKIRRTQNAHTGLLVDLVSDVAELKTDMVEVKSVLAEILWRLPPAAE